MNKFGIKVREAVAADPENLPLLAVIDVLSTRIKALREDNAERGDISITTVIVWVAVIACAIGIAGVIGILASKYKDQLTNSDKK
ncbi:hypothetical protein PUR71_07210 [Streptomyces sp. SP17BM10]|uniref:hypothetical protein n=1 Tax=Streptomyces sp. SP17BM10 TaxID=3002530 RepID=UPI002E75E1A1|nr:hypothetical protein [Streptomyces sp. SP17BM10]MEE1782710.1 hypothetical protein [Streptomyces sp. SP17BM10]